MKLEQFKAMVAGLSFAEMLELIPNEAAGRALFESIRWPAGIICPHCHNENRRRIYAIKANPKAQTRAGLYSCGACQRHFTATVGTVIQSSHIPLQKWMLGMGLILMRPGRGAGLTLQRSLGLTYRTAWRMARLLRRMTNQKPYQIKPPNPPGSPRPTKARRRAVQCEHLRRQIAKLIFDNEPGLTPAEIQAALKKDFHTFVSLNAIRTMLFQNAMQQFNFSQGRATVNPRRIPYANEVAAFESARRGFTLAFPSRTIADSTIKL